MQVNYYPHPHSGDLDVLCDTCAGRRPMEYRGEPGLVCDHCGYEEPFPDPPTDKGLTWAEKLQGIDGL